MKRKTWSVGLILCLSILVGSFVLVICIIARPWSDNRPPLFNDLNVVSGYVEYIIWNEGGEHEHSSIEIKLHDISNEFLYWTPYLQEVHLALTKAKRELSTVKLWVALRHYNYPTWGVIEVWQAAVNGVVISSYEDRVDWGESHVVLRKSLVVSFILLIDLFAGMYLKDILKKQRGMKYQSRENEIGQDSIKQTVSK